MASRLPTAISSGIAVVAAAGNYACDAAEVTPGGMTDSGILVVGSAEADGSRSSYSNYGNSVDVYFYGRDIVSCSRSGGYVADSGTSMAAPHISALCAMVKLSHPSDSPEAIASRIQGASGVGLCIPCAINMVPQSVGFSLRTLSLRIGNSIQLPCTALPESAQEEIQYESSDETIAKIVEGRLCPVAPGQVEITVKCKGLEEIVYTVSVHNGVGSVLKLPFGLVDLEDEAFWGLSIDCVEIPYGTQKMGNHVFDGGAIWFVDIPETVNDIGENSFSDAVIMCREDSNAHIFAQKHNLQFILQNYY